VHDVIEVVTGRGAESGLQEVGGQGKLHGGGGMAGVETEGRDWGETGVVASLGFH